MKNRLMIYFFYDKDGIVDGYVTYFLQSFRAYCKEICVVINGFVTNESKEKLEKCTDKILIRENSGFDSCAYKYAIEEYGYDDIKSYDELILANFTMYGPIFPPDEMFEKMEKEDVDFWGITKHPASDYIIENTKVNEHIQSYFVLIKNNMLKAPCFKTYWDTLQKPSTYREAIAFHELRFTKYFEEFGFKSGSYIKMQKYEDMIKDNAYFYPVCQQIEEDKMPFIKRKIFIGEKELFEYPIKKGPLYLFKYLKNNTDYNYKLILSNIKRTYCFKDSDFKVFKKLLYCSVCLIFLFWKYKHYLPKIEAMLFYIKYRKFFVT